MYMYAEDVFVKAIVLRVPPWLSAFWQWLIVFLHAGYTV